MVFSHTEGEGAAKSFNSLKGARNMHPVAKGGGGAQKVSDPRFFHFAHTPSL